MEKYVKVKKIGEGSFGTAYLARSKEPTQHGKQVVLKEINMTQMSRKERDEARKEVAVLAQLKHSNIVSYLESFEDGGILGIVMDFCDGGDLYSRINGQRGALFSEEQILDWFVQMCLAVKHIHDRKILHRDIKSQNIFLTRHGIVKLGDFGIAKVLNSTIELAKTCIGTPYYLSPEICEAKPYNNKSDIWSLGCVLYELTTLKHAFEAGNMKVLVMKIVRGNYPPPPTKYSLDLRNLIAELFRRNPRDRPSVNTVLKKPLLQTKIRKFLSDMEFADEFSHTVIHGKLQKPLPPGGGAPGPPAAVGAARPLPPKPIAARKPPTPATPRYNPASVYAPSSVRKSKENKENNRKSSESRKSSGGSRPSSAGSGNSRPPSAAASPGQDFAKRRQELVEKERLRREELRKKQEADYAKQHKDLLEKQKNARIQKQREEGWRNLLGSPPNNDNAGGAAKKDEFKPSPAGAVKPFAVREIGNYDRHFENFRQLEEQRGNAASPVVRNVGQNNFSPVVAAKQGELAGHAGVLASEHVKQIKQEYFQRRQEAALNRARGQGWGVTPDPSPRPNGDRPLSARSKDDDLNRQDDEQKNMKARLQQIRQQNLHQHAVNGAANKLQAADLKERWERKLADNLDQKRRQGYEQEQKKLQLNVVGRPVSAAAERGVGLTAAMQAVGKVFSKESEKSVLEIKREKEDILKRINAKVSDRKKWQDAEVAGVLGDMELEQTSSCMEATGDINTGVKSVSAEPASVAPRRQWGAPHGTMVKILGNAKMTETAVSDTVSPGATTESDSQLPDTNSSSQEVAEKDTTPEPSAIQPEAQNADEADKPEVLFKKTKGSPSALAQGLSTGHFDVADVKLLRTCSEPDLSRLAGGSPPDRQSVNITTGNQSDGDIDVVQQDLLLGVDEDNEESVFKDSDSEDVTMNAEELDVDESLVDECSADVTVEKDDVDVSRADADDEDKNTNSENDEGQEKHSSGDEAAEICDETDDDDMATMRASMASILANDGVSEEESVDEPALSASVKIKKKKAAKKTKVGKKTKKKKSSADSALPRAWSDTSIEEFQSMKETMKSVLRPDAAGHQVAAKPDLSTIEENAESVPKRKSPDLTLVSIPTSPSEPWLSDDTEDDYFEDGDMFTRLEEIRVNLEKELGLDAFRDAYRTVQNFQDDDDEAMEEGIRQVTKILGHDKVHLYPSILQLVMADGAYTEGND